MPPSIAYNYFHTSDDDSVKICKLCSKSIKCRMRGSSLDSSHLLRHIQGKHPELLNLPSNNNEIVEKPSTSNNNILRRFLPLTTNMESRASKRKNLKLQLRKDNNASPGVKIKRNKKKTGNGIIWFPHKQKLYEWIKMQ